MATGVQASSAEGHAGQDGQKPDQGQDPETNDAHEARIQPEGAPVSPVDDVDPIAEPVSWTEVDEALEAGEREHDDRLPGFAVAGDWERVDSTPEAAADGDQQDDEHGQPENPDDRRTAFRPATFVPNSPARMMNQHTASIGSVTLSWDERARSRRLSQGKITNRLRRRARSRPARGMAARSPRAAW